MQCLYPTTGLLNQNFWRMEVLAFEVVPSVILMHTLVENAGHSDEVTVSRERGQKVMPTLKGRI